MTLWHLSDTLVVIRGGGDLATGVAHRLHRAGFTVMVTELPQPLCVRRAVSFAEAVYAGAITVEGVTARLAPDPASGMVYAVMNEVPVVVDRDNTALRQMRPPIVVDARMAKRPLDTALSDARLVIGLGPGFTAGLDCHAVIETNRGHHLGRVLWSGGAEPDTGVPEAVRGFNVERVLRAPRAGVITGRKQIGEAVRVGEVIAQVERVPIIAQFDGVLRGLLHDGVPVTAGMKVGDLDPRGVREHCFTISDKARAVAGGVLEAIFTAQRQWLPEPPAERRDAGLP
jgi:xanthine dehydrogenase accessory factor